MQSLASSEYMIGPKTQKWWWTAIPALPLSREDRWYRVLRHVFFDSTWNYKKKDGSWQGFYTETSEIHQTVSVFHNFSVFDSPHWVERLLAECGVAFVPPIKSVRWQYELCAREFVAGRKIGEHHADIAIRIVDGLGPGQELALVLETKREGGKAKEKDLKDLDCYIRTDVMQRFKRKHVAMVKHVESNFIGSPRVVAWKNIANIQISELDKLDIAKDTRNLLSQLLRRQLERHGIATIGHADDDRDRRPITVEMSPRVNAWMIGLQIGERVSRRIDLSIPLPWLHDELGVDQYANKELRQQLNLQKDYFAEVW